MYFSNTEGRKVSPDYKNWVLWLRSYPIDMQFDKIRLINIVLLLRNNIFVSLDSVYRNISCFLSFKYFLSS